MELKLLLPTGQKLRLAASPRYLGEQNNCRLTSGIDVLGKIASINAAVGGWEVRVFTIQQANSACFKAVTGVMAIAAAVCSAALPAGEDDPAQATVMLKKGDSVIFFGDSLTALAGQEAPKEHVTKGYVRIVRETLEKTHADHQVKVDWVATGGHTVPDLLKRVEKDVIAKKPTIVVIQIGCNDARRIPKETFKTSLEELIDKLQGAGIQVIQCSLTSVGEKHDGTNRDDAKLEEFAQVEREVAKAKKVPLNDLRKAFVEYWKKNNPDNQPSGVLTYDGNHFNQKGMDFVADEMLKKFK